MGWPAIVAAQGLNRGKLAKQVLAKKQLSRRVLILMLVHASLFSSISAEASCRYLFLVMGDERMADS